MNRYYAWDECVDDIEIDPVELSDYEDRATQDAVDLRHELEKDDEGYEPCPWVEFAILGLAFWSGIAATYFAWKLW